MLKKIEKIYDERIIKYFYILLPVIEMITTYMVINTKTSITAGMIYKTLFLVYTIIYLLFFDKINKKLNYILLGIFTISIIANVVITMESINVSSLVNKAITISKYICFPISLIFLYKYHLNGNRVGLKTLAHSATIYATIMIIARVTGTHIPTYDSNPNWGHTGWFYSGNEISALMSMFYPITIYFCSKYENKLMKYSLVVVTYGLLTIGTKTSFVAIVVTLTSILIFEIIMYFAKKQELSKKMLFTIFMLIVVVLASAPYSPSMTFIADRFEKAKVEAESNVNITKEESNKLVYNTFIFNGREVYIDNQLDEYKKAPIQEKIFGLSDSKKVISEEGQIGIVERDLYDLLFTYGIFGVVVYFIPMLIIIWNFVKKVFSNFKEECNEKNLIMVISIVLTLGISYIAGHVLLAPTVSLFLAVIFSKLNYEIDTIVIPERLNGKKG